MREFWYSHISWFSGNCFAYNLDIWTLLYDGYWHSNKVWGSPRFLICWLCRTMFFCCGTGTFHFRCCWGSSCLIFGFQGAEIWHCNSCFLFRGRFIMSTWMIRVWFYHQSHHLLLGVSLVCGLLMGLDAWAHNPLQYHFFSASSTYRK